MAKQNKKLEEYTNALLAVAEYRAKNAKVFGAYNSLQIAVSEAEAELKKEVRDNVKTNIANDKIKVTYSPAYKKYYDLDIVIEMAKPKEMKALEAAGGILKTLDKSVFEDLVEKGVIPVDVKQAAFREEEMAPRVSIKEQKMSD